MGKLPSLQRREHDAGVGKGRHVAKLCLQMLQVGDGCMAKMAGKGWSIMLST